MRARHLRLLRRLLSAPTAPFYEEAVVARASRWARRRRLAFARDSAGNVLLRYRRGRSRRRWVFAAHMDHPGFVARRQRGRRLWADFIGSVRREYFRGSRVRMFAPGGEVRGTVAALRPIKDTPWLSCRVDLDESAPVPAGTVGTWDLPAVRIRGKRLAARTCDDVAGVAAVICALGEIASAGIDADVTALLTRAEEAAFIGCLAACRDRTLPDDALIVAVEASKAVPGASLGDGVVVRAGDAVRTYDPSLTAFVADIAGKLAKRDRRFGFVRRIMPGGVCESTAYSMYGYTAAGLCLPMENYHNYGRGGRVAAEIINTDDFTCLVKLLTAIAADGSGPERTDAELSDRLRRLLATRGKYLHGARPSGG